MSTKPRNREKVLEYKINYRIKHRIELRKKAVEYYYKNKENILNQHKKKRKQTSSVLEMERKYRFKHREKYKQYNKDYQTKNKEKLLKNRRIGARLLRTNIHYKISHNISCYIQRSLKDKKNGKHWETIVGYSLSVLMTHLANKFKPGMNFYNYGDWQIDHIIPISLFKYSSYDDESFKQCWALNNLQPLWREDNLLKRNKIIL